MPTFLSRRYARRIENVGITEKVVGVLVLLLTGGIVAALAMQVATDETRLFDVDEDAYSVGGPILVGPASLPANGLSGTEAGPTAPVDARGAVNPFPEPDVQGWRRPSFVSRYSPENLYVKIDGRAAVYLRFHVSALTFGTYYHQADAGRTIDVYWYDMGEPANASGIYGAEAAPEATPVPIGSDGYQIGGAVFFWKSASYVQLLPSDLDEADARAALRIARRLAELIE